MTGQLPVAYDLDDGWLWRIEGAAPWDARYVDGMARFLDRLDRSDVAARQARVPSEPAVFEFVRQQTAVTAFIKDASWAARADKHYPRGAR